MLMLYQLITPPSPVFCEHLFGPPVSEERSLWTRCSEYAWPAVAHVTQSSNMMYVVYVMYCSCNDLNPLNDVQHSAGVRHSGMPELKLEPNWSETPNPFSCLAMWECRVMIVSVFKRLIPLGLSWLLL